MREMVLLICFGLALIAGLAYLLWRSAPQTETFSPEESVDAGSASWPRAPIDDGRLIERIFGEDDWHFLKVRAPRKAQRVFRRQRRELAIEWLGLVRDDAKAAMLHHLIWARTTNSIEPALEARIAANYVAFQMSCAVVFGMVLLRLPVPLGNLVRWAGELRERVHRLAGSIRQAPQVALTGDR
jgi:hypothetical protein